MPRVLAGKPQHAAGRRDKYVTIQQLVEPTGGGYPAPSWTPLATVWMSRLDLTGDERFTANQDAAYKETQFQMPYLASMDPDVVDVAAKRRLSYEGRIYDIRSGSVIERKSGIELIVLGRSGS